MYICSRFCVVTTMPAVRGRLGCAKGSLCFLLVACSDVDIVSYCACDGNVVV